MKKDGLERMRLATVIIFALSVGHFAVLYLKAKNVLSGAVLFAATVAVLISVFGVCYWLDGPSRKK